MMSPMSSISGEMRDCGRVTRDDRSTEGGAGALSLLAAPFVLGEVHGVEDDEAE